jgi:predicted tellurium resistance membrane protein TerC
MRTSSRCGRFGWSHDDIAASFIARLLQKHRWIAYIGLAVILYVALGMVYRGAHELRPIVSAVAGLQ